MDIDVILDSASPDWSDVSLRDVNYRIQSCLHKLQALSRYPDQTDVDERKAKLVSDLHKLFAASAQKHAERGIAALDEKIADLEVREKTPYKIKPFDNVHLDALRACRLKMDRASSSVPEQS